MSGHTTNWFIIKPNVGADADVWGGYQNTNRDFYDKVFGGVVTTTGSANAYICTSGQTPAAYSTQRLCIKPNFSNTGACTLNLDGLGAKNLMKDIGGTPTALAANDLRSGIPAYIAYDGTQWLVTGQSVTGVWQPLDGTLTAVSNLSWSSLTPLLQFTAADTVSLTSTPGVTSLTATGAVVSGAGTAGAPGVAVGATDYGVYKTGTTLALVTAGSDRAYFSASGIFAVANVAAGGGAVGGAALAPSSADPDTGWYSIGANNLGGTVGGSKFLDVSATLAAFSVAVQAPQGISSDTGGTLTSASRNKTVNLASAPTIDGNVFTAGDFVVLYNNSASARAITQGSTGSPTQRLHGTTTTGNLTLAVRGYAVIYFISATEWVVMGDVS